MLHLLWIQLLVSFFSFDKNWTCAFNFIHRFYGSVELSSKIYSYIRSLFDMKIKFERNRTSTDIVLYSLSLYFLGLSLQYTSKGVLNFRDVNNRNYVSVWNWIQRFGSCQIYKRKRLSAFMINETVIQIYR